MERTGISLDIEYLKEISTVLSLSIQEVQDKIYEEAKYTEKFNINSPKQLWTVSF